MDTSKKYILMCEKAKEVQTLWKQDDGDYMAAPCREEDFHAKNKGQDYVIWLVCDYYSAACYQEKEKKENHLDASPSYFNEYSETFRNFEGGYEWEDSLIAKRKDCIWLPRQDQLQEMVFKGESFVAKLSQFIKTMLSQARLGHFVTHPDMNQFESMEQLWLAFVMREKYDKTWNGKNWIMERLDFFK